MRIRETHHASTSIYLRNIPRYEIEEVIRHPDTRVPQSEGQIRAEKLTGDKTLRVVFKEEGKDVLLVTVYYLD